MNNRFEYIPLKTKYGDITKKHDKTKTHLDLSFRNIIWFPSIFINLTELKIDNNKISHIPPEICMLTNLIFLKLDNNQITSIPSYIGKLITLQKLYLHYNLLTKLPREIENLINLTSLNLSRNQLTTLEYLPKNIEYLNVNYNKLRNIKLSNCKNLEHLLLMCNDLKIINPLTKLNHLELSYNKFKFLPVNVDSQTPFLYNNQIIFINCTRELLIFITTQDHPRVFVFPNIDYYICNDDV